MIITPAHCRPLQFQASFGKPLSCRPCRGAAAARPARRSASTTTCKAQDVEHSVVCFGEALFGEDQAFAKVEAFGFAMKSAFLKSKHVNRTVLPSQT